MDWEDIIGHYEIQAQGRPNHHFGQVVTGMLAIIPELRSQIADYTVGIQMFALHIMGEGGSVKIYYDGTSHYEILLYEDGEITQSTEVGKDDVLSVFQEYWARVV